MHEVAREVAARIPQLHTLGTAFLISFLALLKLANVRAPFCRHCHCRWERCT
jgi:hypothetical protein